jgi:AraC-like DNA-binding protein
LPASGHERAHVWKFSWEYGGRRPRHFHAEPELNLVVAGSATFGVGQFVVRVSAGELLGFPPGQDHVLLETSPDIYLFAIGMEPKLSSEVLGRDRAVVSQPLHLRLPEHERRALVTRAGAIVDRIGVEQKTAELWEYTHWLRQKTENRLNGLHVLTRRALEVLFDEPASDREHLARRLQAQPSAISRYFHRDLGVTLVQYRARLKLLRYIRRVRLENGHLMLAAKSAGFGSYSQCHRVFQSELGCSPREFFLSGLGQCMQGEFER